MSIYDKSNFRLMLRKNIVKYKEKQIDSILIGYIYLLNCDTSVASIGYIGYSIIYLIFNF